MKRKILLFLLFLGPFVFSQSREIKIIVIDIDTQTPVDEVTITALKTRQGFLTNAEGIANFVLDKPSDLEFSHSSYKEIIVKSATLNQKLNIVYLESKTQQLEEVVLTKEHPQEILKELVENSIRKITVPANLKVYLREFYKKNDEYVFFNDGLLNFQILGDYKNLKTDILVEQNRTIGLLEGDIDPDVLGYNLNNIIENYYQFRYLGEVLDQKALKLYDFQVKSYPLNQDLLIIKVVPYLESKGVLSDFQVLYNTKKKIILEVSAVISQVRLKLIEELSHNRNKVFKLSFKNTFNDDKGFYYLANSKEIIGFSKKIKNEYNKIEVLNNMVVTNFDKKPFKYNDNNIFKDKTLINKKSTVFTNYWDFESGLVPTTEEKTILDLLDVKN
ncbi:hypothetical protein ACFS5J_05680 [Flavobacterium chuncheonense]|uniref:Carboxypeptidase-like regulatory domain-containing protein n=1 Tax=Flavobacterium chuncheonense TaxID=2026653 RepID=A0ABW5YM64_9FLAO